MTVLVTGGAGYIGNRAVLALRKQGRKVAVVDDLSTGDRSKVIELGIDFIENTISDIEHMRSIIKELGVTAIMHFAGSIDVGESVRDPLRYYRNNVEASVRLLEAATHEGVETFIFSSSAAVYGTPQNGLVGEGAPLRPLSPYGHSKAVVEQVLQDLGKARPFRYMALRYFNVAGGGYTIVPRPTHLIRAMLAVAMGRQDHLKVFGTDYPTPDGTAVRDYIHIEDLIDVHLLALRQLERGASSAVYNCGYGHGSSVLEVHRAAQQVVGKLIPLRYMPRRAGDAAAVVADASKLRAELHWRPARDSLEGMIKDQYAWELSQQKMPAAV